jgi:hypothetical protein
MSNADLPTARALLEGFLKKDKCGRLRQRYLRAGSQDEADARRALAKLLRSNGELDRGLRDSLANLFEPDPPAWEQRKINIVNRRRGKLADCVAATQVLKHMAGTLSGGSGVNDAIASAADKFSMSDEMVKRIWLRYRRTYDPGAGREALLGLLV